MLLPCPHCKRRFKLSPDRIPAGAAKLRCPACKGHFVVDTAPLRRVPAPAPEPAAQKSAPDSPEQETPPRSSKQKPHERPSRNLGALWALFPVAVLLVALIGFLTPAALKTPTTSVRQTAPAGPPASCALPSPGFDHAQEEAIGVKSVRDTRQDETGLARAQHAPTYRSMWPFSPVGKQKSCEHLAQVGDSARQKQVDYELMETRIQLEAYAESLLFRYDDALRKLLLYRDGLAPKAEQSLNTSYAAYRAGELEFLSVLEAQRQLLSFQLKLERARADLGIRQAELEMLMGRE